MVRHLLVIKEKYEKTNSNDYRYVELKAARGYNGLTSSFDISGGGSLLLEESSPVISFISSGVGPFLLSSFYKQETKKN